MRENMTPSKALEDIRRKIEDFGAEERRIELEHEGCFYRIVLNSDSFVVYRVNHCSGHRHHVPGWPVCLITKDSIFQECFDLDIGMNHSKCGITIDQWLEIALKGLNKSL